MTAAFRYPHTVVVRRLLQESRPYWPHIAGIVLLDILATPLSLLKPLALRIAVDSVVGSNPLPWRLGVLLPHWVTGSPLRLLAFAAVLQVLIILLIQLQALGGYLLNTQTGERLTLGFRSQLFRHIQRLSLSFHDARGTADSLFRIEYDAPSIQSIVIHGVIPFIAELVMLIATIYVIARIDWQLALVALTISPFLFFASRTYDRRMGSKYEAVKELESRALGVVQETLTAVRVVKAFGRENSEQERFLRHSSEGLRRRVRLAFAEAAFGSIVNMATAAGTGLVLFIGVRNVQSGLLTLGALLMVIAYLSELYGPLESMSNQIASLQSSLVSARRAFEILDEVPEVVEREHARPLGRATGAIEFRQVSFAYDQRNVILDNFSIAVPAGARVGIAGRTGAGKSTLVSLLTRFYDPTAGQILLDGLDLRDYKLTDLRNQFALVLQEPLLFSTSIAENIAYARPDASAEEIAQAAKAARAHDFIVALPDGYRTKVGERGMMVSGGERQRISLARAFLKDAPILILDEPTSAVDLETEGAILEALERLMHGRTSFIISHRLSALENCDILLVLEDGRGASVSSDVSTTLRTAVASAERSSLLNGSALDS